MQCAVRRIQGQGTLQMRSSLHQVAGPGQHDCVPELRGRILWVEGERLLVQPIGLDPVATYLVQTRKDVSAAPPWRDRAPSPGAPLSRHSRTSSPVCPMHTSEGDSARWPMQTTPPRISGRDREPARAACGTRAAPARSAAASGDGPAAADRMPRCRSWSVVGPTRHATSRRFGPRCPIGPRRCLGAPGRNSRTTGDSRRWP